MSKVKIEGNASGTGTFTVASPNSNTDRTLTLPDHTGEVLVTDGGAVNVSSSAADGSVTVDASGNVGIGTASPSSKLDVLNGKITAGTSSSVTGSVVLEGKYSDGALAVWGTERSSGGAVMGSGVTPSTTTADEFFSSTGIGVGRGAYTIAANTHKWYVGASQTVSIGSTVTTSEAMRIDSNGTLQFNSGYGSVAPAYACRAWALISYSGGTPTIEASGNVSSITDFAAGRALLNFTTAMPDTNYSVLASNQFTSVGGTGGYFGQPQNTSGTTTYADVVHYENGIPTDPLYMNVAVFR